MFPIRGDMALLLALVFGAAFGALLHRGRVLDFNTIVNQLRLRDFTVLKVMLTAIIVGGIGVFLLADAGAARFALRDTNLLAVVLGAGIFGIGIAIYGYCPGTGIAAMGTGNLHAGAGVLGMLAGGALYAFSFDWVRAHILPVGAFGRITLMDATGLGAVWVWAGLVAVALAVFTALERARR